MFRLILFFMLLLTSPAFAVTQWSLTIPASGDSKSAWPAAVHSQWTIMDTLFSNYRNGLDLIYKSSTAITISTGEAVVSNSGGSTRLFLQNTSSSDITASNLDSGSSFSAGTTYYVYCGTSTATASTCTYYISTSSTSPSGVTYYKKLGSFYSDSSSAISLPSSYDGVQYSNVEPSASSNGTSYSASTEYTNTSPTKLMVVAYATAASSGGFQYIDISGNIGAASASTEVTRYAVFDNQTTNTFYGNVTFIVPVGWKWKVSANAQEGHTASINRIEAWQI